MRETNFPKLDEVFLKRWSPRAYTNQKVDEADLKTLFEAARWAPSCFNEQPWRFVHSTDENSHKQFLEILVEGNQTWAKEVPVLVACFSKRHFSANGKDNEYNIFDAGAAWMAIGIQATRMGLHCHAMAGFHKDKAYEVCKVDRNKYEAVCMIAIGYAGNKDSLPDDLKKMEKPNGRKDLSEIVFANELAKDVQ